MKSKNNTLTLWLSALVAVSALALTPAVRASHGADDKPGHDAGDDHNKNKGGQKDGQKEDEKRHGNDDRAGDDHGVDPTPHVHGGNHH